MEDWNSLLFMAKYLNSPKPKSFPCGICGAVVAAKAKACPDCGADSRTGLHDGQAYDDSLDLPDEDFDYEDFVHREFEDRIRPHGIKWYWWLTALVLVALLIWGMVEQLRHS